MDPENPVVRLCARGMANDDGELFLRAWEVASDDYERCVAAHYVARTRATAGERLRWNLRCLELADAVGDARVAGFYPSLHAALGQGYEEAGDAGRARAHFERAAGHAGALSEDAYGNWLRIAVAGGLRRTGAGVVRPEAVAGPLGELVASLGERGESRALALLLPAQLGDLGGEGDTVRLGTAVRMVLAADWLGGEREWAAAREVVAALGG